MGTAYRQGGRVRKGSTKEELYNQYLPMMTWIANHFASKFDVGMVELVDEAESMLGLLLTKDWNRFDPERSSASTWIYHKVYWCLYTYCVKEGRAKDGRVELTDYEYRPGSGWLEQIWGELGQEGRMLLRVVLEAPEELGRELWCCRRSGGRLRYRTKETDQKGRMRKDRMKKEQEAVLRYLRSRWSESQIQTAWNQVEEVVCG